MMTEFVGLGSRIGITLPITVDERLVITRKLGDFRTSMLNDIEAGRPLEVEGLLGVVVEMADKLGEPVPASRAVYALARAVNPGREPALRQPGRATTRHSRRRVARWRE